MSKESERELKKRRDQVQKELKRASDQAIVIRVEM